MCDGVTIAPPNLPAPDPPASRETETIVSLPLASIRIVKNIRDTTSKRSRDGIYDLARSLRKDGQLEPIAVYPLAVPAARPASPETSADAAVSGGAADPAFSVTPVAVPGSAASPAFAVTPAAASQGAASPAFSGAVVSPAASVVAAVLTAPGTPVAPASSGAAAAPGPLTIVSREPRYGILFGHRRYLAALQAELPALNCVVRPPPASDTDRIYLQATENEHKKTLSAADRERYIADLLGSGEDTRRICERLRISPALISQAVKAKTGRDQFGAAFAQAGVPLDSYAAYLVAGAPEADVAAALAEIQANPRRKRAVLKRFAQQKPRATRRGRKPRDPVEALLDQAARLSPPDRLRLAAALTASARGEASGGAAGVGCPAARSGEANLAG